MKAACWVGLALITISPAAFAFSADSHKLYGEAAFEAAKHCVLTARDAEERWRWFIAGLPAEDAPRLWRLQNWHYPHLPGSGIPERYALLPFLDPARTDFREQFTRRVRQMLVAAGKGNAKQVFTAAGRIAHYIQDMRVPAHVIPIQHGSLFGEDAFDKYDFSYSGIKLECDELEAVQPAGGDASELHTTEIMRLADAAMAHTRHLINETAEGTRLRKLFWCLPAEIGVQADCDDAALPGMGSYRRGPEFGAVVDGTNIARPLYLSVFKDSHKAMLRDTAKVFAYAAKLLERSGK